MITTASWVRSLRAYSFPASLMPVLVATAVAVTEAGTVAWWTLPVFSISALLVHAGTNVLNDYYDYRSGVDRPGDPDPTHVITRGIVPARFMLISGRVYFAAGVLVGSVIAPLRGPGFLAAGLAGALAAYGYTNARFSLKYRALGDLAVFILMGPALVAMGVWALTGEVPPAAIVAALPLSFFVTAILHGNNLRDIAVDARAGVDTVARRLGHRRSTFLFAALVAGGHLTVALAVVFGTLPPSALLGLLSAPLAWRLVRRVLRSRSGAELVDLPLRCAQHHLVFSLLHSAGLLATVAVA